MTPTEVRKTLAPLGVERIDFALECDRPPPPAARVVFQQPDPGKKMTLSEVRAWLRPTTVCNKGEVPRACQAVDLRLNVTSEANPEGRSTYLIERFVLENAGDSACQLRSRASLRLTRVDGREVRIRGNPGRMLIDWRFGRRGSLPAGWLWDNVCPSTGRWHVEVRVAALRAAEITAAPPCLDRSRPSALF